MKFALVLLALAAILPAAQAQSGAIDRLQSELQSVEVPAGERLVLKAEGSGVQVYRCDGRQWNFVAPEAKLFAKGLQVATHGAGPVWRHSDGSAVFGEVLAKAPSPNADSIPLLLLKAAKTEGSGIFASVNYIQRMETNGGNAPAVGCDADHAGSEIRVNYGAMYLFYTAASN
jgi:hypothetical protein